MALFVFAVQLLGTATEAAAPLLERMLRSVLVGDAAALGVGWLAAYGPINWSVVVALSLLGAAVVTTSEAFLLVAGSRLGGAAVVVLVMALATALTLAVLAFYEPYAAAVDVAQDPLLGDGRALLAFAVLLLAVPLALLVAGHLP
ncbi:MAG: hypothetical protein V5A23_06220 [Halobacteriales archaeon]